MLTERDISEVASNLLAEVGLQSLHCEQLQALWAGYGFIYAIEAVPIEHVDARSVKPEERAQSTLQYGEEDGETTGRIRLVLKVISPSITQNEEGHLRKMFSYEVEQYFYERLAPRLPPDVAVAKCLATCGRVTSPASEKTSGVNAILMTDLRTTYPVSGEKRSCLSPNQVHASIRWLAKFHSSSWALQEEYKMEGLLLPPLAEAEARKNKTLADRSIWLNGGYTYLATRRTEYAALASDSSSEWSTAFCSSDNSLSVAEKAARFLTPQGRSYETFIHGDVKSENLFSTESGDSVAFFDFQYIGFGLGVSDIAKLFTCSVPLAMLTGNGNPVSEELTMQPGELSLLTEYHRILVHADTGPGSHYEFTELKRHWETALVDWCRFQASWGFWGNTAWLQGRVRSILRDGGWKTWLDNQQ